MAIEDVFNGAKTALTLFDAYTNTVAQEIGMERAVSLMTKMSENIGAMQGKMMKQQSGIKEFDAKAAASLLRTVPEGLGLSLEVLEESPKRVVHKIRKCSVYEAAHMLGINAKAIETMCRASSARFMDTFAKQLNPNLSVRLAKFRSAPDDFCLEETVLG
jgi:predicted hydrocarbon binding protein